MGEIDRIFRRREDPMTCPSGYSFDAYCKYENPDHGVAEFPHNPGHVQTYGEAVRELRVKGWVIHRDGTATCPKCATRLASKGAKP